MEQEASGAEFEIRDLLAGDTMSLITQLRNQGITLVGMGSDAFLGAFVDESLSDWRASIVVATESGKIIGWSIAVINPRAFWKKFFLRHPLLAVPAIRKRFATRKRNRSEASRRNRDANGEIPHQENWTRDEQSDWGASRNSVARHIDITVTESRRGAGIGSKLQDEHLRTLSASGITRVDAVISTSNTRSIHFHIKQGWTLASSTAEKRYATKSLPGTNSTDGLSWSPQSLRLPLALGEVRLFTFRFEGIRSDLNIFSTPAFDDVQAPVASLRNARREAAYLYSCPVKGRMPRRSFVNGYMRYVDSQYRHYYVDLSGDFVEYLAKLRSKTRSMLKRKVRNASASNTRCESFRSYTTSDEMESFLPSAEKISKTSYQNTLLGQGLPQDADFRESVKRQADQGRMKGFVLFVEDTPVAYNLCPVYGDQVVLYDYTGYDPAFGHYSPGTVLQYHVIRYLFADENAKTYDLCTGEGQHKELFATGAISCANIFFFAPELRWKAVVFARISMNRVSLSARGGLERVALKGWVKKAIRRGWR